ncbi:MAG: L-glutamate gamma-semialdehyde dehydrogenase [Gammaproteobacteria bacterium]|nr:L-glutamate gamma-semialdehyde dehydrogenase [Gammaproteobacteria bacterium]
MTFSSPPLRDEAADVHALLPALGQAERHAALHTGRALVAGARQRADERPYLDAFLQEFGLSNQEGIALMCLAEALLRIPDDPTADRLIAEKIASGDWDAHAGRSGSLFVNASTWGLMLTGRLVELPGDLLADAGGWLRGLGQRVTEPLLRNALRRAMQIIGGEFVVGRSIGEALARCRSDARLARCSFDMLGEAARTDADAARYTDAYAAAIEAIGAAGPGAHTISIKLSALDPRYSLLQAVRVRARLLPRALELARLAAARGLGLTLDAEEQDRLEISLQIIEALARDPSTREWPGLGLAVQAYGRRAPAVIEYLGALARELRRPLAVRLVKGAYWDSEIKRAQERGLAEYPVYTRKCATDVAYLACARKLLAAAPLIYPQFATHNAHTIGAILALRAAAPTPPALEFQRLHGMGVLLYDEASRQIADFPPVRVYAPVGPHAELLAYLVRRLLENGANTSFVNRFMDATVDVEDVVVDPLEELESRLAAGTLTHPGIPLPQALYGSARRNSAGLDFGREATLEDLRGLVARHPLGPPPAFAKPADVIACMNAATGAFDAWQNRPVDARARCLEHTADLLEADRERFLALLVAEAGKTFADAVAEIREAADFCRYYATLARQQQSSPERLDGPTGETNELRLVARGVFACISPWNFPLAIFAGQVVAALVTGNTVLAKPAEATSRVALAFAELLHRSGVPREVLHVLPMPGREFGDSALEHAALAGVVFTGSTTTGRWLNRKLAARDGAILPLIAETGGINAMIVDSSALPEQVVDDVLISAFGSAGQRCSALRLLCLQEDIAERVLEMLTGAMDTLVVGDPRDLATDIGPLISAAAAQDLQRHIERMLQRGRLLKAGAPPTPWPVAGNGEPSAAPERQRFLAPHLIELASVRDLDSEAFGPVLHVVRYAAKDLPRVLAELRENGYGLTLGIQTRLEGTRESVQARSLAGNVYVNRNMVGAVVGVQPFGGAGLSGTGPKAGGPHYLMRFVTERTFTVNTTATGGNTALLSLD